MVVHELRYVNPKPRKPAEMGICQVAPCLHYPALKLPLQGGSVGLTVNIPKPLNSTTWEDSAPGTSLSEVWSFSFRTDIDLLFHDVFASAMLTKIWSMSTFTYLFMFST